MSSSEVVVVLVGAPIGYWLVSRLLTWKGTRNIDPPPAYWRGESGRNDGAYTSSQHRQPQGASGGDSQESWKRWSDQPKDDQQQRQYPPKRETVPSWHEVLALTPTATIDEIKTAYRKLIGQYHPDRVANLGPELRDLALKKTQAINHAYSQAIKDRGDQL